jgi:hypothetical protein
LIFSSEGTSEFWQLYRRLPLEIQNLARRNYGRWRKDPFHPSLHFKKVTGDNWSIRLGLRYRALGKFTDDGVFLWEWIGSHAEYDRRL